MLTQGLSKYLFHFSQCYLRQLYNRITLDAKGIEHQPDTAGDYVEVCLADGIPVYRYNKKF